MLMPISFAFVSSESIGDTDLVEVAMSNAWDETFGIVEVEVEAYCMAGYWSVSEPEPVPR